MSQRRETSLFEVPVGLARHSSDALVRLGEESAPGEELEQDGVRGVRLDRSPEGPDVARPRNSKWRIETEQRQRRDEPDGECEEDAQVVDARPALATAHLSAPSSFTDPVRSLTDLATDERHVAKRIDEVSSVLDGDPGHDDGVAQLTEISHLAGDEEREYQPADDPDEDGDVEEADEPRTRSGICDSHAPDLPVEAGTRPLVSTFSTGEHHLREH